MFQSVDRGDGGSERFGILPVSVQDSLFCEEPFTTYGTTIQIYGLNTLRVSSEGFKTSCLFPRMDT